MFVSGWIVCLSLVFGQPLQGQSGPPPERVAWANDSLAVIVGTAALDDDTVVVTGYPTSIDRQSSRILAVAPDGTQRWQRDAGGAITPPLVDREGRVAFAAGGSLFTLDPAGNEASRIGFTGEVMGNLAQGPGDLILGLAGQSRDRPDRLYRFDQSAETATSSSLIGFLSEGIPNLAVTADGLALAFSTRSTRATPWAGSVLWNRPRTTPTPLPDQRILLTSATELQVVDRFGEIVSRLTPPGIAPGPQPLIRTVFSRHALVTGDGTILFADRTNLVRWRPEQRVESFGTLPAQLADPQSLALDSAGRVLVHRNESVWVIGPEGDLVEELTGLGVVTTPDILSPPGLPLLLTRGGLLVIPRLSPRGLLAIRMPHGLDPGAFWASARGDARCSASALVAAPPLLAVDRLTATASWVGNRLRWRNPQQSAEYEILRSEGSDPETAVVIGHVDSVAAAFEDTNAPAGQLHYWVRSVAGEEAALSDRATTQTRPPSVRPLAQVSNPRVPMPLALDDSGQVLFSDGNQMTAITISDGAPWKQELAPDFGGTPIVEPDGQILLTGLNSTLGFTPSGADRPTFEGLRVQAVSGSGRILVREVGGTAQWMNPDRSGEIPIEIAGDTVLFDAVAADGTLFGLTADWQLVRLEPDGAERWRRPLTPYATNLEAWPRGAIGRWGEFYCVTDATGLTAVDPDGSVRWHRPEEFQEPVLGEAGTVLAHLPRTADTPDALYAMDPATGATRWLFPGAFHPIGAADGTVFCLVETAVYALDEATGAIRWAFDASPQLSPQPGAREIRLDDRGTLVGILFDQVFEIATGTRPARSGWPMARHDARNTAAQGARGDVPLEIELATSVQDSVLRLHAPPEQADGLWLISSNLYRWRFAEPDELRVVPDHPASTEVLIPTPTPDNGAPVSAYFRLVRP